MRNGHMKNAATELRDALDGESRMIGADIEIILKDDVNEITLYEDFTEEELEEFWSKLDVEYDSGYGTQYVFGKVWLKDGGFLERREYDGSEWWTHQPLDLPPARPTC